MAADGTTQAAGSDLQLEVTVNKVPLNLIAAFAQLADGKLASPRSELNELGIAVPGDGHADELIRTRQVPGLSYVYDDENQTIEIEVAETSRAWRRLLEQRRRPGDYRRGHQFDRYRLI